MANAWKIAKKEFRGYFHSPIAPIVIAVYFHATRDSSDEQREAIIADATRLALKAFEHG